MNNKQTIECSQPICKGYKIQHDYLYDLYDPSEFIPKSLPSMGKSYYGYDFLFTKMVMINDEEEFKEIIHPFFSQLLPPILVIDYIPLNKVVEEYIAFLLHLVFKKFRKYGIQPLIRYQGL